MPRLARLRTGDWLRGCSGGARIASSSTATTAAAAAAGFVGAEPVFLEGDALAQWTVHSAARFGNVRSRGLPRCTARGKASTATLVIRW